MRSPAALTELALDAVLAVQGGLQALGVAFAHRIVLMAAKMLPHRSFRQHLTKRGRPDWLWPLPTPTRHRPRHDCLSEVPLG